MSESSPTASQDHSLRNPRQEILDAAAALLGESGEAGLTIRRLALRSGYTSPAIYQEFGDKAGLLDAILTRSIGALAEGLGRLPQFEEPVEELRAYYRAMIHFGREHPTHYRLMEALQPDQRPRDSQADALQRQIERPLLRLARDPEHAELMRQALWSLLHGLILLPPSRPDVAWREDLDDTAFEAMLAGLLGSGGSPGSRG